MRVGSKCAAHSDKSFEVEYHRITAVRIPDIPGSAGMTSAFCTSLPVQNLLAEHELVVSSLESTGARNQCWAPSNHVFKCCRIPLVW